VVLIMIAFTVPTLISQWGRPGIKGNQPVAHYYNKTGAISNDDIRNAQFELGSLKLMGADLFLRSRPSLMQTADIPSLALSQAIFAETQMAPLIAQEVKRIARQQQLRLTDWQVDDFFRGQAREKPEILWLLLKAEARQAGFAVDSQQAGAELKAIIPQLPMMRGATAEQVLKAAMDKQGVDQMTLLRTFADLLAVLQYATVATQNEDVTIGQLKYETLRQQQAMDVETVAIDAGTLAKKAPEPTAQELQKQFAAYKAYAPFEVNSANPYGFGYKQPPRVQIEWMLVEVEDVAKQIPETTAEQAEEYYLRNQSQFTIEVPSDPNDPNSPKVEKLQSYAEVAAQISKQLRETKIAERADNIISTAKDIVDANLAALNIENLTTDQLRKLVGSYEAAAERAGQQFTITVHTGKTGLVNGEDILQNDLLGRLYMTGQDKTSTPLVTMVFAIDELKISRLGPFGPPKPRMYESIGPFKDFMQHVVGLARITGAEKAGEPCSIDITYAKKLPIMKDGRFAESNDVYAVKDAVKEDVKKLSAMPAAKQAAEALLADIPKQGWDNALAEINKQYGVAPAEANKPENFRIEPMQGLRRISEQEVRMTLARALHNPVQQMYIKRFVIQKELIDNFYSLLEPDKTVATNVPMLVEFKPEMTYYVIKNMSRTAVDLAAYQQMKDRLAFMQDYLHGQSQGFEHFKADNIIRRMKFEWDEKARGMPVRPETMPEEDVI
jgi:hypothetical protein